MSRVAVEVYLPLLTNEKNQDQWSEMVAKDVTETFSEFVANVQITQGNILGTTTLPLPPQHALLDSKENPEEILRRSMSINPDDNEGLEGEAPKISHKDRVHQLESCLITWTKQIKSVLKREPEQLLSDPTNPGPLEELDFWKSKSDNLNSIFTQLQSERVRRLLRFLDQAKSTYNGPFAKVRVENAALTPSLKNKHALTRSPHSYARKYFSLVRRQATTLSSLSLSAVGSKSLRMRVTSPTSSVTSLP